MKKKLMIIALAALASAGAGAQTVYDAVNIRRQRQMCIRDRHWLRQVQGHKPYTMQ